MGKLSTAQACRCTPIPHYTYKAIALGYAALTISFDCAFCMQLFTHGWAECHGRCQASRWGSCLVCSHLASIVSAAVVAPPVHEDQQKAKSTETNEQAQQSKPT
mmetsp:Transcript_15682/g.30842  ORF Transcript_15682/g.30842 Transcript_15682/m.30842 type:complete len:104 (+) Transcript_15682:3-314(+)